MHAAFMTTTGTAAVSGKKCLLKDYFDFQDNGFAG
jgi:hypothetical protein